MKAITKIKQNIMTPKELLYLKYQELPIKKNTVLLEGAHGREFSGHIYALAKGIMEQFPSYKLRIAVRGSVELPDEFVQFKVDHLSNEYFRYLATAEILINDTSFWSFFNKRSQQKYYIFWHGTPLKRLGKATQIQGYANIQRNLAAADKIFVSNHFTKEVIQKDFGIIDIVKNQIVVAPSPRNALLFIDRVVANRYVYMPTWRGKQIDEVELSSQLVQNLKSLDQLLTNEEEMFVKLHPYEEALLDFDSYHFKHLKKFPKTETYTFLQTAEKIITDYSSIMFDFSVTQREVILFVFDEKEYENSRGTYIRIDTLPFKRVHDIEELVIALRQSPKKDFVKLKNEYCLLDNINGTEQVLNFILENKKCENIFVYNNWNGKENVLIYAYQLADNGITASLFNFFDGIDLSKRNYILTWQEGMIPKSLEYKIRLLPKNVYTFIGGGKVQSTLIESIATLSYMNECITSRKAVEQMYLRDFRRQYPNLCPSYFIHYPGYDRSYASWMWILKKIGIKTVIFVHTDIEKEMALNHYLKRKILFQAYREADKVVCVTKTLANKVKKLVPEANTMVVNVLINTNKVINLSDKEIKENLPNNVLGILEEPNNKVFINIGRFSKQKGLDRLLQAFEAVEARNAYLLLVESYGPERERIKKQIEQSRKKDAIYLLENVSNPFYLLKRSDYFIFSSRYEGLGMVVLEALVVGTPVIMTEIPETLEILGNRKKTIVVDNSLGGLIKGIQLGLEEVVPQESFSFYEYEMTSLNCWENIFSN